MHVQVYYPNFVFNRKYSLIHLLIVVVMCSFFCANGAAFEEIRIFKAMVRYANAFKSISLEQLTVDRPDLARVPFHNILVPTMSKSK